MNFLEHCYSDFLNLLMDVTTSSSRSWNMKPFVKEKHRQQCHDQNVSDSSTCNDANVIEALELEDKERVRKDRERADKKRNQFKKSQQHLKSKQKYKSYNRIREELVDASGISETMTFGIPNVSENKLPLSNFSSIPIGSTPATKCPKIPGEIYSIPNITSKSTPATDCLKRKNPFESKQTFRIRKAKPKSLKLYSCLREKYNILLVCKTCLIDVRSRSSQWKYELLKDPHHKCPFDHLAVREKSAKTECWSLVRDVRGKKAKVICHQFMIGEKCRMGYQCPYPHTMDEMEMWFKYLNGQVLPAFIEDLSKSDLRLRIELLDFHKKSLGLFIYYCSICSKNDPPIFETKRKHVSFCRAGHKWIKKLFYKGGSAISEVHSVEYQCNQEHCILFHKLLKLGFMEEEIVLLSESINQSMHSRKKQQIKFDAFDYEIMPDNGDYCEPPVPLEEALDDEKGASSKWIGFPYQDLDEYYRQNIEEEYDKNVDMSGETYYQMFCTQKLKELLKSSGGVFKRCRLNLKGTNRAVCEFLDINKDSKLVSVELRSRTNCGPCFDGDEVVVQLKDTKELGDDEAIVKRGTVVGVLNHAFNRREYTYLCKVDPYINHLMIPVNGIGPKLHVLREKSMFDHKNMIFVYENVEEDVLHLKKSCYLSHEEKDTTLFVVKYMQWNFSHMYPLGYVCGMLRAGSTVEETQVILDVIYQIPNNYDLESGGDDPENFEAPAAASEEDLTDLTDLLTISIDPENSKDIDDAISIEKCPEGHCNLIVHISDVSHYVSKGDECDKEASKRMTSYYPLTGVRSMLPKKLSDNWCSLLEGKKRRTLSVYFHCDKSGRINLDQKPIIKETLIKNKKQFSYKQVQRILDENRMDGDLNVFVQFLFSTSQNLRKDRLKMGWLYHKETELPFTTEQCFEAHQLIEEFMILTNTVVAKFLVKKFPLVVPLRCQEEPNEERKSAWIKDWSFLLEGSVYFDRFFGKKLHKKDEFVTFLKATVIKMDECMKCMDGHKNIIQLVGNESNHPLHAIALIQWFSIQENAFYACSGDVEIKEKYHYSLNPSGNKCEPYVQFTSPIRRYLDLVVHRLVKAALNNESSPYSCLDVMKLCSKANIILHENRKYNREVNLTKLSIFLERPLFVPIFISELNENLIEFVSPFLPKIKGRYKQIKYNQLSLSDKPDKQRIPGTTKEDLHLMWDKRIFDAQEDVFHKSYARQTMDEVSVDPKRHIHEVKASLWRTFLSTLYEGNKDEIQLKWQEVKEKMNLRNKYRMGLPEVTSEMKNNDIMARPQVKFSLNLEKGSVLPVLLGKSITDGYLRPQIKMISITDQLDICLCHKRRPIECFVTSSKVPTLERYPNVNEYLKIWLPILSMEAASTAVDSRDSILCHNVPIRLQRENDSYYGWLKLEKSFCKKRKINIDVSDDDGCKIGDFLCIRFPLKQDNMGGNIYQSFIPNKWVCHAVAIHDSSYEKIENGNALSDNTKTLSFKVQQFDCMPPDEVMMSDLFHYCTVEFLSKPLPEKKMGEVLACLDKSSDLCKVVALGHSMEHLESSLDINGLDGTNTFDIEVGTSWWFYKNNHNQSKAIYKALTRPFTLIQGPPGTGKTVTAVKIAWWFAKANKRENQGRQVLYCGPSNSSVDVAAEWLKRLGPQCPKIVRVYGKQLERQWYPLPRYSGILLSRGQRNDLLSNTRDENTIDLHHLIRRSDRPYAQEINKYDKRFRDYLDVPEKISDEKVDKYERLLDVASKEELKSYDIILCTCTASSSSRIKGSKFGQLIIDECGMCKEPESLIPLANHKEIKQVVLIGDHKQLQPIVKNRIASDLGLKTSLFERYHDDALMLNYQYRMHEKICEFPSKQFYNGHLKTIAKKRHFTLDEFWPTLHVPLLFCHVEGAEKSMIVSTSEGNEESKSNKAEAIEVVRIYREMRFKSKVCILSQYGAQCNLIKQEFAETGHVDVPVTTVVSSQGNEFDYVILSLVRSMPAYEIEKNPSPGWCLKNLGFITDEHQINVALTRAKHGLIILGNKYLLRCNDLFNKLLKEYERMGCVINSEDFKPSQNRFDQGYTGDKFGKKHRPRYQSNKPGFQSCYTK